MTKPDLDAAHPWNRYVERKRAQWAREADALEAFAPLPGASSLNQAADDCDCPGRCVCGFNTRGAK